MSEHQIEELPVTVFYSYAHEDKSLRNELDKHLSGLRRSGIIAEWYDRQIIAGANREDAINTHLNTASVILLLISPDFLASDYCFGMEMQRALERHRAGEARVIPVILRPVDWRRTPFADLQCLPHDTKPVTIWRNIDEAFLDVADGIRKTIESIKSLPAQPHSLPLPPVWNIPYPRNPFFTGREDLLVSLESSLKASRAAALTQPQAISGLGGIGKTQIAVEYAYRNASLYQAVFWAQSETHEALVSSFVVIAHLLHLFEKDARDQLVVVKAVMEWMKTHTGWLLILDNSDDLGIVGTFIPPVFGGHILLTTRAQAMGRLAQRIEVGTMIPEVGALLLLRRATLLPFDASLEEVHPTDREIAMQIVQELGGLPLALDQAGAYIEETACRLSEYLSLYQRQKSTFLKRRGGLIADHPAPVATTWLISFDHIKRSKPIATEILRLCAFLYPDSIPEEILTTGLSSMESLRDEITTPLIFNDALEALCAYSFVKRDRTNQMISVHRLVQVVLKDEMNDEQYQQWAEQAVRIVNKVFPHVEFTSWHLCERYLTNAQICAALIEEGGMTFPEAANLLYKTGWYLKERGQYKEARPPLQQALIIREHQAEENHNDIATSLNSLGSLSFAEGKYVEAEQFHRQALTIREKQLGPQHPATAMSLNNLAWLYYMQGKYIEADLFYMRALAIFEQCLGAEHPETMTTMTNLAWLYYKQGKYAEAEQLYTQVLMVQERRLEPVHISIGRTLNNLGLLYSVWGKYAEAEPLLIRALTICEKCFGPEHPETMMCLNNLGILYYTQGRYTEAEPLYIRALAICKQHLGLDHPEAAKCLGNLGRLYHAQGRYTEAEPLQIQSLAIREQHFGAEHPETARSINDLASLYYSQGRYAEAEPLYTRALAIREQRLGAEHPETAICLGNIAQLYDIQRKFREAEAFYIRSLAICERSLGQKHPSTILILKNYAQFLWKIHKEVEAKQIEVQVMHISKSS